MGLQEEEEEEGLYVSVGPEILLSTWIGALLAAVGCTSWRPGLHCIVVLQHL